MKITDEQLRRINDNRNTELVTAARANDAACDRDGLEATLKKMGLDLKLIQYVFEQRAMRQGAPINAQTFAFFLDALAIGWTARGFQLAQLASDDEGRGEKINDALYDLDVEFSRNRIVSPITHADYDAWTR